MNKNLVAVAVLAASAFTTSVFASDGQVNFTGTIIPQGCDVSSPTGGNSQTVNLGQVAVSSFPTAGAVSASKGFSLLLTNCPSTVSAATVRFDGTQVPGNNSILALTAGSGVATGVGIQIADNNNKVINLYQDSTAYPLQPGTAVNTLGFVASYISTAATVTPGSANAVANFTIVYQ